MTYTNWRGFHALPVGHRLAHLSDFGGLQNIGTAAAFGPMHEPVRHHRVLHMQIVPDQRTKQSLQHATLSSVGLPTRAGGVGVSDQAGDVGDQLRGILARPDLPKVPVKSCHLMRERLMLCAGFSDKIALRSAIFASSSLSKY